MNVMKVNQYVLNVDNIVYAQMARENNALLFPANTSQVRTAGTEADQAIAALRKSGFIGDENLLINPKYFILARSNGPTTAVIELGGILRPLIVPTAFLKFFEPEVAAEEAVAEEAADEETVAEEIIPEETAAVSSAGNKARKKTSAK